MVKVMADASSDEYPDVLSAHFLMQFTQVDHSVHHLCDAETVSKVMERIVSVIFLNT